MNTRVRRKIVGLTTILDTKMIFFIYIFFVDLNTLGLTSGFFPRSENLKGCKNSHFKPLNFSILPKASFRNIFFKFGDMYKNGKVSNQENREKFGLIPI